jgi:uncharacterized membrane-anchored protein
MLNIWSLLAPVLIFAASAAALFVFYWMIRLAVRHGTEDARRRRARQREPGPGWDTARF